MKWQPIETAPKDETPCIVAAQDGSVGEAAFHGEDDWWWANSYKGYWSDRIDVDHGPVTHWMPLPEPPEAE